MHLIFDTLGKHINRKPVRLYLSEIDKHHLESNNYLMKSIFEEKIAKKSDVRIRESLMLAEKKASSMELARKNFCMKGIKLSDYENSDGSYSLF